MIGQVLALIGAVLVLLSGIGAVRFPDAMSRMHALAKGSTLGVLLIFGGAVVNLNNLNDVTSVVLAGVFHLLASPPASNMVSRAAYLASGMPPGEAVIDEGAGLRAAAGEREEAQAARPREGGREPSS